MNRDPDVHAAGRQPMRAAAAAFVGTTIEWYDFYIYATASALIFGKLFFPGGDPFFATLASFGTFAVGFFARPFGGLVFGHLGDRIGRKKALVATLAIMGVGTVGIGFLPTYASAGVWAPVLLVLLRVAQGIAIGGEWGGAVLMVVENAPKERRGFLGSLVQVGNPIGNLAALGVFALASQLPEQDFLGWAWRIPFLISIVLIGVGLFIRLKLHETPAFRQVKAKHEVAPMPVAEVFRHHKKTFFTAVGLKIAEISYASIAAVFILSYATQHLGMARATILNGVMLSSFVALFSIPLFGWLSDRFGRRTLFFLSCLFCAGFAFPMFALLETRDPVIVSLTVVVAISFGQMVMFGVGAPFYSELFTARLRYSGASLGFQIGAAISGGLTPVVAAALMAWSGGATWPVSLFLIFCALITAIATWAAPETAGKELT